MRKIVINLIVMVILVSFLSPSSRAEGFNSNDYTGEQLFEGIFFGYGEVGKQFPELWEQTEFKDFKLQEGFVDRVHKLENDLKKIDKDYFVKFKKDTTSGDRLKIKKQFEKINKDVTKIGEEELSRGNDTINYAIKPGFVVALAYAYVGATHIAAAAVLTVVAAGNTAIVGNKVKVYGLRSSESESGTLSQEEYIDLIAQRL
ncbi:TPA: hypothetical protein I1641_001640 [Staphylococcus pseudintermedius]|nr:hypothetical protein [Staphylococcus pseudintermedius]EJG0090799.1 hypothetical protein [Staphylococcus pseudintermedius]HAR6042910.1 hypothetical protein [Staphylococcus pseudintermedius]